MYCIVFFVQLCQNEHLMDSLVLHQHMTRRHSISLLMYHFLITCDDDSYCLNTVYRCRVCDEEGDPGKRYIGVEYVAMMNHIKSAHGLRKPEYLAKYGRLEYACVFHRCLYCGDKFRSGEAFKRHLEGREGVSTADYRAKLLEWLRNPSSSEKDLPLPRPSPVKRPSAAAGQAAMPAAVPAAVPAALAAITSPVKTLPAKILPMPQIELPGKGDRSTAVFPKLPPIPPTASAPAIQKRPNRTPNFQVRQIILLPVKNLLFSGRFSVSSLRTAVCTSASRAALCCPAKPS